MSTASLVCLCLVLVAVAAQDCGEQGCAAEDDSAALLQAAVSFGAVHSGDDVTLEESGNTQALLSPRAGKNSNCKKNGGGVLRTSEECGANKHCSWDGSECASGCHTFRSESSCPTDYCVWYGKKVSAKKRQHCGDKLDYVNLGGKQSHNFNGASSQRHMVGNKRQPMAGLRPQLSTKWRSKDGTTWTACAGEENCWHGGGSRATDADLRVELGSPYFKARVDVMINCEWNGKMRIEFEKLDDARFSVWYNGDKRADTGDSPQNWDHRRWNGGNKHIDFRTDDADPILRMELSKLTLAQQAPAEVQAKLYIMNVPIWFEKCMDTKATHGQCLKEFVGGDHPLRSDHALQCRCIQECASGTCPNVDGCQAWNGCMSDISKDLIVEVIKAFDPTACPDFLLQTDSAAAPALLQQNATSPWTSATGGCDDDSTTCSDPSKIDVESFDCTCYDSVIDSTDPANPVLRSQGEIRAVACPAQQSHICCSWKNAVKCPTGEPVTLLETGEAATLHEKTMTHRSEQAALAEGGSLDDSLSGKRCA